MDNILQMKIFTLDNKFILVAIRKLIININAYQKYLQIIASIITGGIQTYNMKVSKIVQKKPINDPIIKEHKFNAYRDKKKKFRIRHSFGEMYFGGILNIVKGDQKNSEKYFSHALIANRKNLAVKSSQLF
ncbi:fatty acid synthase-like [Vespula squamosa]|uniref:Fatty acid synthase-like n=1 Tax=Vespula squamosa TaxID=30214 RepID=A0ABD2AFA4_VESSQ